MAKLRYGFALTALFRRFFSTVILNCLAVCPTFSPTFQTLHSFGDLSQQAGVSPYGALAAGTDSTLYGTTSEGLGGGKWRRYLQP